MLDFLAGALVATIAMAPAAAIVILQIRQQCQRSSEAESQADYWREAAANAAANIIGRKISDDNGDDWKHGG